MGERVARALRRTPRWLGTLPVSLALHVVILASIVMLVSRDDVSMPLMIDLNAVIASTDDGARGAARSEGKPTLERDAAGPAPAPRPARPRGGPASDVAPPPRPPVTPAPSAEPARPAVLEPPAPASSAATLPPAPTPSPPPPSAADSRVAMPAPPEPAALGAAAPGAPAPSKGPGRAESDAARAGSGAAAGGGPGGVVTGHRLVLAPGTGGAGSGIPSEYEAFYARLRERVQQAGRYPPAARRRGASGTVELEIAIEADGMIASVSVVGTSSHDLLDRAAADAARSLRRQPFPSNVRPQPLTVRLPVVFELQ